MVQWEYKVVVHKLLSKVPSETFSQDLERSSLLNAYGSQGWELVGVMNQSYRRESDPTAMYGYTIASYFLKRPAERPIVEEGKGDITNIDRLRVEGASRTRT